MYLIALLIIVCYSSTHSVSFLRSHSASIAELYLPAIQTVLEAPSTSPIADVDVANMADFIINLSSPVRPNVSLLLHNLNFSSVPIVLHTIVVSLL